MNANGETMKWRDMYTLAKKVGGKLVPYSTLDAEIFGNIPENAMVRVKFFMPRSITHHRWYWAFVRIVQQNTSFYATPEGLHEALLMACGMTRPFVSLDGEITMVPSSIAFEAMDETEFREYTEAVRELVSARLMPGADVDELMREAKRQAGWEEKKAA